MKTEIFSKSNTPKTKRGEDRQKKLLNTAIKVFLEHGYEGASLEKIILDAGGSRSTIYSLYGSKKGLFLACLKSLVEEVYFAYAEHYDESRPWEDELIVFWQGLSDFDLGRPSRQYFPTDFLTGSQRPRYRELVLPRGRGVKLPVLC